MMRFIILSNENDEARYTKTGKETIDRYFVINLLENRVSWHVMGSVVIADEFGGMMLNEYDTIYFNIIQYMGWNKIYNNNNNFSHKRTHYTTFVLISFS